MPKVEASSPLPLYYQLYSILLADIEEGRLKAGQTLPPERKLADSHGVSRITVVKALDLLEREGLIDRQQGRGTFVKERKPFTPAPLTIAFLPGGLVHPYHYSVQTGIAEIAAAKPAHLNVLAHYQKVTHAADYELSELSSRVDGLIIYPKSRETPAFLTELVVRGLPVVMVDRYLEDVPADAVVFDDEVAAYTLTQHLIQLGHKHIAFVNYREPDVSSTQDRLSGFVRAMEEAGLDAGDEYKWLELYADYLPLEGRNSQAYLTEELYNKLHSSRVTALVAVNHDVSNRLAYDLTRLGGETNLTFRPARATLRRIRSLDVAGFGHRHPADYSAQHVATAMQPGEQLGRRAAELLFERLSHKGKYSPTLECLPVEIIYTPSAPRKD